MYRTAPLLCLLAACASPEAAQRSPNYRAIVAYSIGHLEGSQPQRIVEISDPWLALSGETMVCVRAFTMNGRGERNDAPKAELIALVKDKITVSQAVRDCESGRNYTALAPVRPQ